MPDPLKYKNKDDFLKACIPIVMDEGKKQDQAIAQCNSMWNDRNKKKSSYSVQSYRIQSFTYDDIIAKLPKTVYDEIKSKDDHPFFQLYSMAHEGIAQPKLMNTSNDKPIHWVRKAIQSIKNLVLKGVKCFKGHNITNDNQDKEVIGEIVHSFEDYIKDKLHHMIITYHPKDKVEIAKKMDICSHEGEWSFLETAQGLIADTIHNITAVAFGNSKEQTPAFSDAKRIGFVQCFNDNKIVEKDIQCYLQDEEIRIKEKIKNEENKLREKL